MVKQEMVTETVYKLMDDHDEKIVDNKSGESIHKIPNVRNLSRIGDWCVLEGITLSDHQCTEFSIQEGSHPVNTRRGGKVRSPSWNTKRLSKDKPREHLEETRLIDELGWARSAGSLEDTVRAARRNVVAACNHSMPRCGHGRTGDSMYWWNDMSCVENALQRGRDSPAQRAILYCARHGKKQNQL